MVVEFVGAPGSGKSTLAAAVVAELRMRSVHARAHVGTGPVSVRGELLSRRRRRLRQFWGMLTNLPVVYWYFAHAHRRSLKRLAQLCAALQFARELRPLGGFQVLDEGPFRILTPMIDDCAPPHTSVLRHVPLPDLAVVVTTDPDVAVARVRSRSPGRLLPTQASDEVVRGWHEAHHDSFRIMGRLAPVFAVDTTQGEPASHARTIVDWVLSQVELE